MSDWTLADIEAFLSARGLRLQRAIRPGGSARYHVTVGTEDGLGSFDATGLSLGDAIENAVAAASKRRPRGGGGPKNSRRGRS